MREMNIDVSVQDPIWETIPEIEPLAQDIVTTTLTMAPLPKPVQDKQLEVSIVLANDTLIQLLNNEYRTQDKPTNVLSFATLDDPTPDLPDDEQTPLHLGDVMLAYQTIEREAKEQGKYLQDHITHLMIHGTLHLLGYDHESEDDANVMETLEIRILEKKGIQNPYTEALDI